LLEAVEVEVTVKRAAQVVDLQDRMEQALLLDMEEDRLLEVQDQTRVVDLVDNFMEVMERVTGVLVAEVATTEVAGVERHLDRYLLEAVDLDTTAQHSVVVEQQLKEVELLPQIAQTQIEEHMETLSLVDLLL
jgi:hypothetical protein